MSSFSRFVHCLACSSTEYIRISKVCFQYMNLGSLYFVSLAKTSCREMLLMTLNAPVTTRSAELYMNRKLSGEIRGFRLVETWLVCDEEYCLGSWHQDLWRQAKVKENTLSYFIFSMLLISQWGAISNICLNKILSPHLIKRNVMEDARTLHQKIIIWPCSFQLLW